MVLKIEDRHALYRLRRLVWAECANVCTETFGEAILENKKMLENEVMKIVRVRWKQQTRSIQSRLRTCDHVDHADLLLTCAPTMQKHIRCRGCNRQLTEDKFNVDDLAAWR